MDTTVTPWGLAPARARSTGAVAVHGQGRPLGDQDVSEDQAIALGVFLKRD